MLAFAAAAQAVGVEPTLGQAALLAAGTNLATAIPAGPGYVGTFELATVTIAASVGISRSRRSRSPSWSTSRRCVVTSVGGAVALIAGPRRRRVPHADASPAAAVEAAAPEAAAPSPDR